MKKMDDCGYFAALMVGKKIPEYTYQVHLYSKKNYFTLLQSLKTAVKAAGFFGFEIEAEIFEQDTGYYHIPVQIKYMEV